MRAHWTSVLKTGRGYDQRADLTSRFIKAPTPIILVYEEEERPKRPKLTNLSTDSDQVQFEHSEAMSQFTFG